MTELFFLLITYLGVAAAAASGVMEARRKRMDIVGACVVAFITALGGGTLRDLLLGRTPVFWIREQAFAYAALAVAVIVFYSSRLRTVTLRSILIPDALGLGVFSILGAEYGLQAGTSLFMASLMGVITGIFGGVLRDVICNEIPSVFNSGTYLYATCSFLGAWVYLLAARVGLDATLASGLGIAFIVALRVLAVRFAIRLPEAA